MKTSQTHLELALLCLILCKLETGLLVTLSLLVIAYVEISFAFQS